MKVKIIFFLCLFVGFISAFAQQFPSDYWHEGKIVLDSGDTLKGVVKYEMQNDLLQFQADGKNQSFTARKVLTFEIFDETVKQYRQFYSLPFSVSNGYKAPVFFELLAEGKITLLCREALENRTYSPSFSAYGSWTRLILVYKYFLLQENGNIVEFIGKKNDWLDVMDNRSDDVQRYAKINKLSFDDKNELVRIITYYNSFFK
ncbi:MAG: hypothetical protein JJE09_06160 [Bacteroidia bacterium]|nr:hypothetical protein [Bacteroidia bacterium]